MARVRGNIAIFPAVSVGSDDNADDRSSQSVHDTKWKLFMVLYHDCNRCNEALLMNQDTTAIFNNLLIPYQLTEIQAYCYTSCSGVVTGLITADIDGTFFTAQPETFAFKDPPAPLIVTYTFPSVTITSVSQGQTLLFVSSFQGPR